MLFESSAEFAAALPSHCRLLGLDVGEKTIGLALSDVMRQVATPLVTISRSKFTKDMDALKAIITEHKVAGLVVGYPVNMDGSLGPRTQSIRTFVSNLQKHTDLPILFWDERMSTMAVSRTMLDADLSRARRAELVDKLAASYILQGSLDRLNAML
ncbi:MAG: Holliday junction resolvase RuvX [Alphaproteobacteria bacterium]|nr:Holliday junction resolvase RuvX [Alphaproteobacteria bacterium]